MPQIILLGELFRFFITIRYWTVLEVFHIKKRLCNSNFPPNITRSKYVLKLLLGKKSYKVLSSHVSILVFFTRIRCIFHLLFVCIFQIFSCRWDFWQKLKQIINDRKREVTAESWEVFREFSLAKWFWGCKSIGE